MNQYIPKNIKFDEEGREKLRNGITTIAKAVKSTLGPSGQTVLIESQQHTHGITVTKDGVTVAKAIELIDPIENLAVRVMRQSADMTATAAGDGTSTSIVLAEALVNQGFEKIVEGDNKTEILRELVSLSDGVVNNLRKMSKAVTKGKLRDVATISANNDKEIGDIISKVYREVGRDGLVTIDKSQTSKTYFETTAGMKVDRGWASKGYINDQERDECVFDDALVLVCDAQINSMLQIQPILEQVVREGKSLLIIAPCSQNMINTLAVNVVKGGLKVCSISPPNFGYKSKELMSDIAISVGATYFSEETGDDLSLIAWKDLGSVSRVVVSESSTVLVKDIDKDDNNISDRVEQLRSARNNSNDKESKEFINSRIASLVGGVGVIYVGGKTDLEQKELYDRVDDAVCAVRSALEEGILPGGGVALYKEGLAINEDMTVAGQILSIALSVPLLQICYNAEMSDEEISSEYKKSKAFSDGYDVKNKVWGDMYAMGVIDPTKVTISALQNAVSVAVTILSTDSIITLARSYEDR
tara:strand:+ start:1337 stop:2926 length:1590 start_codon:yes stop_codon:yes gene_type:complete